MNGTCSWPTRTDGTRTRHALRNRSESYPPSARASISTHPDTEREPLGTTGRRKYHEQVERERTEKFWKKMGTSKQVQEKLGLGRLEKYHGRKYEDKPGTAKGDMTTYREERKRMRLAREELAAQQPDEVLGGAT